MERGDGLAKARRHRDPASRFAVRSKGAIILQRHEGAQTEPVTTTLQSWPDAWCASVSGEQGGAEFGAPGLHYHRRITDRCPDDARANATPSHLKSQGATHASRIDAPTSRSRG